MNLPFINDYLRTLTGQIHRGDAREESFYPALQNLIEALGDHTGHPDVNVTVLPKKTEAGNPDFRVWDGHQQITGYVEAKVPGTDLDRVERSEQLQRYRHTFPNLVLTDFFEFRLYRDGQLIDRVRLARPFVAVELGQVPPAENIEAFVALWQRFFDFSLPPSLSAEQLAVELAKRTRFLRHLVYDEELRGDPESQMHDYYRVFKQYLIHTLSEEQFADLYAQTVSYGLFAARTRAPENFNRELAYRYIPRSIGILYDMFKFISVGDISGQMKAIIDDIAQVLRVADITRILRQYDRQGRGNDPIMHFYETFLAEYSPEVRERRGVYYTPQPVVRYIIDAVHRVLQTRFDRPEGLAAPGVTLLDPAAGTMTFPAQALRIAVEAHVQRWGSGDLPAWIRRHILPRFYAFELLMAPYAIGHLKMGFILEELGVELQRDERFRLYLTNTLELEHVEVMHIPLVEAISEESRQAEEVKRRTHILVVTGNPPYSGISANRNEWTERLLKSDEVEGVRIPSYYKVDGEPLHERNPKWLQDDYVKFLRFAQWKIAQSGQGTVAMITNHSYLDNPTFRGMRQSLMDTFDLIYILNLHGNSLKRETAPGGGKDENVFDIRQGVAIGIFIKRPGYKGPSRVFYRDLWGKRAEKYRWLQQTPFNPGDYEEIRPRSPWYFFVPRDTEAIQHYNRWPQINKIFPVNSVGIITSRDKLTIKWTKDEVWNTINNFIKLPEDLARQAYNLGKDARDWKVKLAQEDLKKESLSKNKIVEILYRPFDIRYTYYTGNTRGFHSMPRPQVMSHMLAGDNVGIIASKANRQASLNYFFITDKITDFHILDNARDSTSLFPLYLYPEAEADDLFTEQAKAAGRRANLAPALMEALEQAYGRRPAPEEVLDYIYGIFHSPAYRERYKDMLRIDFPRVPFTADATLFEEIARLGRRLRELHLLRSPLLDEPAVRFEGPGDNMRIEHVRYEPGSERLYINDQKYFAGITPDLWQTYVGGYQVLRKWLKDRKGRLLEPDEIRRFIRMATALARTAELQPALDENFARIAQNVLDISLG